MTPKYAPKGKHYTMASLLLFNNREKLVASHSQELQPREAFSSFKALNS